MIRKYYKSDIAQLIELYGLHHPLMESEEEELRKELMEGINIKVIDSDDGLKGMYNLHLWVSPSWGNSGELVLSVREVIGDRRIVLEELLDRAEQEIDTNELDFVMASFEEKDNDQNELYKTRGFNDWFAVYGMIYQGGKKPYTGLHWRIYSEEDFEAYHIAMGDAFERMRRELDIRPYNVFEDTSRERVEVLNKQMEGLADNTIIFFEDDLWVGSAMILNNEIGEVFVVPEQKKRGYGKRILNSCVNLVCEKGYERVFLNVVDWNLDAIQMYLQEGFQKYVQMKYVRKTINRSH